MPVDQCRSTYFDYEMWASKYTTSSKRRCVDDRCATIRYVAHVTPEDGHMNATVTNTERMVCDVGYRFTDGSAFSDITCVNQSGVLVWEENIPECEGKTKNAQICIVYDVYTV